MHLKPAFGRLRLEQSSPTSVQHWMTAQDLDGVEERAVALAQSASGRNLVTDGRSRTAPASEFGSAALC